MKLKYGKILLVMLVIASILPFSAILAACDPPPGPSDDGYALTYAKGAYLAEGEIPETQYYDEGEEVTLAASDTFAFEGHTFAGWTDGTTVYGGGATFTMPAHDVTMSAKWVDGDPDDPVLIPMSVGFENGNFVFSGSVSNITSLYVYTNNTNVTGSSDNYVTATIDQGSFTAEVSLDTLLAYGKNNTPFNLRYKVDSVDAEMKNVAQGSLDLSATCTYREYSFSLQVNSGSGCVAIYYKPAPNNAVVTATSISFDEDNFVVEGTIENVTALYIYLINTDHEATKNNFVEAEITGNSFTATLSLTALVEKGGTTNHPFNLRYRVNDSALVVNIPQGSLDLTQTHSYGGNDFSLGVNNGCVAIYYSPTPSEAVVTATSISFEGDNFVVTGNIENVTALYIYLINTYHPATEDNFVEAEITDNSFTATLSLTALVEKGGTTSDPFNLRYRVNDSSAIVNIPQGSLDLTQTHSYGGNDFKLGVNSGCVAITYSPTPEPDYSISVSNMYFADGKFVVEGTCGISIETLTFHINNTTGTRTDVPFEANINSTEKTFKAEVVLADIKKTDESEPPASYLNVRYEKNGDDNGGSYYNLLPGTDGDYSVDPTHAYADGSKLWTLHADNTRTYLNWKQLDSVADDEISVYSMYFEDGKFIVEGACGANIETLIFHLNNTNSPKIDCTTTAVIEDGAFKAEIALADIKNVNDEAPNAGTYINVRYEKNGDNKGGSYYNLLPADNFYTTGAKCTYDGKAWEVKSDTSRTYLTYSAAA